MFFRRVPAKEHGWDDFVNGLFQGNGIPFFPFIHLLDEKSHCLVSKLVHLLADGAD